MKNTKIICSEFVSEINDTILMRINESDKNLVINEIDDTFKVDMRLYSVFGNVHRRNYGVCRVCHGTL